MATKTIPVENCPDPEDPTTLERCCFCRTRTSWWTKLPNRTGGQQVACCESCSKKHVPDAVPTKTEWCEKERRLTPRFV